MLASMNFLHAISVAAMAHHTQRRKSSSDPYIIHPIRVGYLAVDAGLNNYACCAAILHDVIEDTDVGYRDILLDFGHEIAHIVGLLTKTWPDDLPADQKEVRLREYYEKILENEDAINVKLLDRIDNLKDMANDFPNKLKWARKYLAKTKKEITPLYDRCNNEAIKVLYRATVEKMEMLTK